MFNLIDTNKTMSCNFEIYGEVEGVQFKQCLEEKAKQLYITGWVIDSLKGTIKGYIEGLIRNMAIMKTWMENNEHNFPIQKTVFTGITVNRSRQFSKFELRDKNDDV